MALALWSEQFGNLAVFTPQDRQAGEEADVARCRRSGVAAVATSPTQGQNRRKNGDRREPTGALRAAA